MFEVQRLATADCSRPQLAVLAAAAEPERLNGQNSPERSEVLTQPIGELASIDAARRQVEHDAFLIERETSP